MGRSSDIVNGFDLFQFLDDAVVITDKKGNFLFINEVAEKLLEMTTSDITGKGYKEVVDIRSMRPSYKEIRESLSENSRWRGELILQRQDGSKIWLECSAKIARLPDHGFEGIITVVKDITEFKKSTESIAKSEQQMESFREIAQNAQVIFYLQDFHTGRYEYFSPSSTRILGYTPEESMSFGIEKEKSLIHPDDLPMANDFTNLLLKSVEQGLDSLELTFRFQHKRGEYRWMHGRYRLIHDERGEPKFIVGSLTDINERKEAEENLRKERDLIARINDTSPVGITVVDREGQIIFANRQAEKVHGWTRKDITDRSYNDPAWKITDEKGKPFPDSKLPFQLVKNSGKPVYDVRHCIEWSDGRRTFLSINAAPLFDSKEHFDGMVAAVSDITHRRQVEDALRKEQAALKSVIDFNPYSISIYDAQGHFIIGNKSHRKLFHSSPGEDYSLFSDPGLIEQGITEKLKNLKKSGVVRMKANWYNPRRIGPQHPDVDVCVAGTAFPIMSDSGEVESIVVMHEDVTERKLAEKALTNSEERYRSLFNRVPVGLYRSTPDGRILDANDALLKMMRYPDIETLLKLNVRDGFNNPERRDQVINLLKEDEVVKDFEFQLKRFDGSIIWVKDNSRAIRDEKGKVLFYEGALEDINDRKNAEEALQRSEMRYRTTIDALSDMLHVVDRDLRIILHSSQQGKWWSGFAPSGDLRGKELFQVLPFLPDKVREEYNLVFRTGNTLITEETTLIDDEKIITEAMKIPIVENDEISRVITVIRNITERRTAEEQNRQLEEKLQQAQKMEAIGRLAGGIAHDFNNLITGINGYSEIVLKSLKGDDPLSADVREIKKASDRASSLTEQLLAFSRKRTIAPQSTDINAQIDHSRGMIDRIIGEDVQLDISLGDSLGFVMIDPHQVDQILINLAANSRDAMPDGGTLTVATTNATLDEEFCLRHPPASPGECILLSVKDNGVGMNQDIMDHMFEPFYTSKDLDKGTGLGLSTVYGIVRQNDGCIEVESKVGGPTIFNIYFPRVAMEIKSNDSVGDLCDIKGEETVLLVEDEEMVRKLAKKILHMHGYKILEAKSEQDAFKICNKHQGKIHLLLTDVVMPEISGHEVYKQLRKMKPEMQVMYMSGYEKEVVSQYGIDSDTTNYLRKPFTIDELLTGVKKTLAASTD